MFGLADIREFHETAAILAAENETYLPLFRRMEIELAEAEAAACNDPVAQARKRLEVMSLQ